MGNLIKTLIQAEIARIETFSSSLDQVQHPGTIGDTREALLRELLNRLLPKRYDIVKGFIVDSNGRQTPQLDAIIVERDVLPPYLLPSDAAIVPIEAALAAVEVKSRIDRSTFQQLLAQQNAVVKLEPKFLLGPSAQDTNRVPFIFFLLGFISALSANTMCEESKKVTNLIGVGTFDGYRYENSSQILSEKVSPPSNSILFFIRTLSVMIEQVRVRRPSDIRQAWWSYLQ